MDAFTPQQTIELVARTGCKKAHMRVDKLFINAFLAGPLLGFGCAVLLSVNASPWYQENAPGLIRLVGAMIFPIGLVMITLTGADLWTTNCMFMTTAFLGRRVSLWDVGVSLTVTFLGNLAGSLFIMAIVFGYGGVFEESAVYQDAVITFVTQKCVLPQWHQIMLRGIGANWLVCMAVFLSIQARESVSKVAAIWFPTATFVALALDHVVANMFFIPMGIFVGAPISVGYYIWKSMIPTAIGNFLGAAVFMGTAYWYLYLTGNSGVHIAFDLGSVATAVDGGAGPMRLNGQDPEAPNGEAPNGHHGLEDSGGARPHGNGPSLVSGFSSEFHDNSPYAKTHKERMLAKEDSEKTAGSDAGETV